MKIKKKILFAILLMTIMVGCGQEKESEEVKKAPEKLILSNESEETELTSRERAESLSVENDSFTFDQLVSYLGQTKESLAAFLQVSAVSEVYEAVIFGESVTIGIQGEANSIQNMVLTFSGTNADSLFIAISEQLGQDGVDEGDIVKWQFDNTTVTLMQNEAGCVVEIK